MFANERYKNTLNRAYYSIFHAIRSASENREKADYLDFFIASKDEAEKQIKRAEEFTEYIRNYLVQKNIIQ